MTAYPCEICHSAPTESFITDKKTSTGVYMQTTHTYRV